MSGEFEHEVEHLQWEDAPAAYLLGALPEEEVVGFERHAERCRRCGSDLEKLRPAADLLPVAVPALSAPASLRPAVMAEVQADVRAREPAPAPRRSWLPRPTWRPVALGALASAIVVLALGASLGLLRSSRDEPLARTVTADVRHDLAPDGRAELDLQGHRAVLRVSAFRRPSSGRVYQVWLKRAGRRPPEPTDVLFTPRGDGSATALVPDLRGVKAVLVTAEPPGGSDVPSQLPPVVSARL